MSQPRDYTRNYNFNDFQTTNPSDPLPASQVDNEFNDVKLTLDDLNANIALIQRDDGKIANASIHKEALSQDALALVTAGNLTPRGDWAATTVYAAADIVNFNDATYLATVAHTAVSAFATDLAAGNWILIANAAIAGTASAVDKFEGDGAQTVFTLTYSYTGNTDVQVYVNGSLRNPGDDYSISTNTITFVTAPSVPAVAGNENVIIWGTSVVVEAAKSAAQAASSNASAFATTAQDWAEKTSGPVTGTSYSSKYWATSTPVTTVSTNIADVTTVAGNNANVTTVAGINADVTTVAGNNANVTTVAGISGNVTTAAGISADITAVAADATDIGTVSANIADVNTVAGISADVSTVAADGTDIGVVAGISSDVTTVSGIAANVTSVAGNSSNINAVVGNASNINAVAADATDIGTVSSNIANVNAVAGNTSNINAVASDATDIGTVATNITNVNTAAGISANITTVAGIAADVTAAATNASDISAIAAEVAKVITVANDLNEATSEIDVVANNIANVNAVGTDIAAVINASNNLSDINAFGDTYFIDATAPSSPTLGDLWFDTSSDTMKVYGASGWQNAGSSVNGTSQRTTYTATAGQTTFAATYDAGYVDVYLNGIKLIVGTDFTASNGTSIVLASGAAAGDTLDTVAYGTFSISNFSINDANDVAASGATNGQFLQYNGSNWVGGTVSTPTLSSLGLDNHDQVTVTAGGAVTATSFAGDGSSLTGITIPTLTSLGIANHDQVTVTAGGAVTATSFAGDGSSLTGLISFASGTKMLFGQTAAPTGWTKITTDNDAALRIVSGTVGSGGSTGLSTALATPSVTGTIAGSTGSHTLTTAEMPSHNHTFNNWAAGYPWRGGSETSVGGDGNGGYLYGTVTVSSTGGGGSHSHSLSATFSGGTAAINVKYVDAIMASKD